MTYHPEQIWQMMIGGAWTDLVWVSHSVRFGCVVSATGPKTATGSGTITLYSADGIYHPDRSRVFTRSQLLEPHPVRLVQSGRTRWEGRALPTSQVPTETAPFALWSVEGKFADRLAAGLGANTVGVLGARADTIDRIVIDEPSFQEALCVVSNDVGVPISDGGHIQDFGTIVHHGSWTQYLDDLGSMTGGQFFERSDGSFRLGRLASSHGPFNHYLDTGHRPDGRVGPEPGTVRNFARVTSQSTREGDEERVGVLTVTLPAGGSDSFLFRAASGNLVRSINWTTVTLTPPKSDVTITDVVTEPLSSRVTVTAPTGYTGRLVFSGRRLHLDPDDNYDIYGSGSSIRRYGKLEVDLPAWWPRGLAGAETTIGPYLRMTADPLEVARVTYRDRQSTAEHSARIAAIEPGDVTLLDFFSDGQFLSAAYLVAEIHLGGTVHDPTTTIVAYRPRTGHESSTPSVLDAGEI